MSQGKIISGKDVAAKLRGEVKTRVEEFSAQSNTTPHLAVVLASDDPASATYVRFKSRAAEQCNIRSTQHTISAETSAEDLLSLVQTLNADDDVDGILVQLPLPKQHDEKAILQAIDPAKDVDGFHPLNAGLLARGDENGLMPCTPSGIIKLIESTGQEISGQHAVILGRSSIVGRPIAEMLLNRSATVTICHSKTKNLPEIVRKSDIVIAAIGRPFFVKGSWIKPGATVIDVGINRTAEGKLVGDVAYHAAIERAGAITPVPGGVGPMTIACLMENTLTAAKNRRGIS
jgi:methylenetetrahydrofolate dehydrogenase (NADP+) / methenyltetrahydrofolate cyclohydrolase